MVTPFDFTSWVLTLAGLLCIWCLAHRFQNPFKVSLEKVLFQEIRYRDSNAIKQWQQSLDGATEKRCLLDFFWNLDGATGRCLQDFIWYLTTALVFCPKVAVKDATWRLVGITWTLGVFFLQQLFAGEMYTAMTLPPELDVIDTFAELATKTCSEITFFHLEDTTGDAYLSPDVQHRDDLVRRLKVIPVQQTFVPNAIKEVLVNVSTGTQCHMGKLKTLIQYLESFGGVYKNKLHISKEYGQTLPIFLILNQFAEKRIKVAFNGMMTTMQESGIYLKWIDSYSDTKFENKELSRRKPPS